ncbi:MAG: IS982 family transposase [Deltaproteobacteria bacterium]|nr:IS982 family transposase [Deltaproteobacteria bacterium]
MDLIQANQDNVVILSELFYQSDEFMKIFTPVMNKHLIGEKRQRPFCRLSICEIMTILVAYQFIGAQNFKQFYKDIICQFHRNEFPDLVSYQRFIEVSTMALLPLSMFIKFRLELAEQTDIYVIDSTPLAVCSNIRINRHCVFSGIAARGKSSMGWFYGFKLHLVINHLGELMAFHITAGNIDDRKTVLKLVNRLKGKLIGDKGYIKKTLTEELLKQGIELITTIRKNMKQKDMPLTNRLLLRKRAVVETVNDHLKNYFQIEHSRHRSIDGFTINILAALIGYTFYQGKPRMRGVDLESSPVNPCFQIA